MLACYRYIELNPVRARMVEHPAEYLWSSYRANAQGEVNSLISAHHEYRKLGKSDEARQRGYRALFRDHMESRLINEIRTATNGNYALGNDRFKDEITQMLDRRAAPGKPGRPRKAAE